MNLYGVNKVMSFSFFSSFLVCLFFGLFLIVPSGYSILSALILIVSLVSLFKEKFFLELIGNNLAIVLSISFFSFCWLIDSIARGELPTDLEKPLRFIVSIFMFAFFWRHPPKVIAVVFGVAAGAIGAGLFALYQNYFEGIVRSGGHMAVIEFGNISMLLSLMSLCSIQWVVRQDKNRKLLLAFSLLGFFMGMLASILSGTRGGWVGVPVLLFLYAKFFSGVVTNLTRYIFLVVFLVFVVLVFSIPQTGMMIRLESAIDDVAKYFDGQTGTSVGLRFEMWKVSFLMFFDRVLLGWGEYGYLIQKELYANAGLVNPRVILFDHPHNEILNVAAKRGLLGLVSLLVLYVVPILFFYQGLRSKSKDVVLVSFMGIVLVFACVDFGLSNVFFNRMPGLAIFSVGVALFLGMIKSRVNENKEKGVL